MTLLGLLKDLSSVVEAATLATPSTAEHGPSSEKAAHSTLEEIAKDPRSWVIIAISGLALLSSGDNNPLGQFVRRLVHWMTS